ncbi:MAG: hypothetical protein M3436_05620 [Pseudomonadota bacterium]|nr:hypothetical protein [Pseudomonadota bacterium]
MNALPALIADACLAETPWDKVSEHAAAIEEQMIAGFRAAPICLVHRRGAHGPR